MGVLDRCWGLFVSNYYAVLVFGLLLAFVAWFNFFSNAFLAAGTFFFDIGVPPLPLSTLLTELASAVVFLLFFSIFLTVIIFQIRRRLVHVHLKNYLGELFPRFVVRVFAFVASWAVLLFALQSVLVLSGVSPVVASLMLAILSIAFLFVPQAIVVDEEGLLHAVLNNFEFWIRSPVHAVGVVVLGLLLVTVLQILDAGIASAVAGGHVAGLVLAVFFVVPFLEVVKTYLYMGKFGVLRGHEERVMGRL